MPPSTEQTPLIQVVQVAPPRERYSNHTLRRFCTIALVTILLLSAVVIALSTALASGSDLFGDKPTDLSFWRSWPWWRASHPSLPHVGWPKSEGVSLSDLRQIMLETPDPETARKWSNYYAAGPHLAGKNKSQAVWTRDLWQSFGVDSEIVPYECYLNYPKGHGLSLLRDGKVKYRASLEEDVLAEDPTTSLPNRVPTFHGYSASGNVTAQYVYANYGSYEDYETLVKAGIDLKGKIALVKYGVMFRGLKVKRAQELGMVGCIIYSDPGDDGDITELNGYKAYPDGPARQPSSVQRGSVQFLSFAPGDPTTIGYPSKPGVPRGDVNISTPQIPSIPISYADALPILKALNGHGPNASSFGDHWSGGGLGYKGVDYNIGPSPASVKLHLYNEQEYTITPLWNTIGIINGTHQDEVLVIGNHRDAWIAGGAADPNSGSAALDEIIRSFGVALAKGWKPQRTIVFASWDGEEYGLVGSTEWVEEYIPWLSTSAFAYLNVDVAAKGPHFSAAGAPLLDKALYQATKSVQSPNQTVKGSSIYDVWHKRIRTMGSGSDFTAFQDFAGIPSIDVGFGSSLKDPVYHYHSNYDSQAWMDKYGDPTFEYHIAIAQLLGLLSVELLESPVLQFNASDYSVALEKYIDSVGKVLNESSSDDIGKWNIDHSLKPLRQAIKVFQDTSRDFDAEAEWLAGALTTADAGQVDKLYHRTRLINKRYKQLERAFLYDKGLDGRSWFKHVVFAPGLWTGYAGATWPGLVESVQNGDRKAFERWVHIGTNAVRNAVRTLE
ncbi:peptidase M28 [Myriangium duriaei CBS 260.36]|uniref:Peptidase M28 n=1 Tax=Myriangium duriaei CBS 260.36 TaxID=1168546 RepID=A0A9P4MEW6_9PEZI|nr:peptidase M28 [Myriangium duriaei CBS 260.36]